MAFIPASLREALIEQYPPLAEDPSLLRLLGALLHPRKLDERSGNPLIAAAYLAGLEGRTADFRNHRYCGETYLKKLQAVLGEEAFRWTDYRYTDERCREAVLVLPEHLAKAYDESMRQPLTEEHQCLETGRNFSRQRWVRRLRRLRREAMADLTGLNEDQVMILKYLNTLPTNGFGAICDRLPEARIIVEGLAKANARKLQRAALRQIEDCPVPVYQPSPRGRSDRIQASGLNLANVKREVRHLLCDWDEVDIKNSQLAIVARLWNMHDIEAFLSKQGSVWPDIFAHLGVSRNDESEGEIKDACKELLYSVVYGRTLFFLRSECMEKLKGLIRSPLRFTTHWIVQRLLKESKIQVHKLKEAGFATTCYGRRIEVKYQKDARSALAQQAQAVELSLIAPLYRLAVGNEKEFRIMLHQHDGVSIRFYRRRELWRKRLEDAFNAEAERQGFTTRLEWKASEPPAAVNPNRLLLVSCD